MPIDGNLAVCVRMMPPVVASMYEEEVRALHFRTRMLRCQHVAKSLAQRCAVEEVGAAGPRCAVEAPGCALTSSLRLLQDEESDEEKEEATAAELEGLKVAHNAEALDAGETVILTLKDRNILEEGDDDPEELEDVLAVRRVPFSSRQKFRAVHGVLLMC